MSVILAYSCWYMYVDYIINNIRVKMSVILSYICGCVDSIQNNSRKKCQ